MQFDNVNVDQVFHEYAKIMEEQGHLKKQANFSLPEFVAGNTSYSEVETQDVLRRMAGEKLYDLTSEDVTGSAHPEGSTKIVDAPEGLGEVETLEAAQKKIQDVAEKKVSLAKRVIGLTNELDGNGFTELAKDIDKALASFLGQQVPVKQAAAGDVTGLIEQLGDLVAGTFTESNTLTDHYRDTLDGQLQQLASQPSASALQQFPDQYYKYLAHLWGQPEGRTVAQNMYNVYNDVVDLTNQAVNQLQVEPEAEEKII